MSQETQLNATDAKPAAFPALEIPCPKCNGGGWVLEIGRAPWEIPSTPNKEDAVPCRYCEDSDGKVVTEFGKAVLEFVGRNLKVSARLGSE